MNTANKLIRQAERWLGLNEADGSFRKIIDLYNSVQPIPRGYKAPYTCEWCAITVTALGYATGMKSLVGAECSVPKLMAQYKGMGIWLGADVRPHPGDIVIYDWDSAKDGDHIGIIEKVEGDTVTAIEGNMSERVGRRNYRIGWSCVTGYARPRYDKADAVFRLYNKNTGEHFYTVNPVEASRLVDAGWKDEGIAWYCSNNGVNVYRLYNRSAGDHFYTASRKERDYLVSVGWIGEGVAFYSDGNVDVYRLYNPNAKAGAHHYTTSQEERDRLVRIGWRDEGIGWKALAK